MTDQIHTRAVEAARLVVLFRTMAEKLRDGTAIAGIDRRRALKRARQAEGEVFNLGIKAENMAARLEGVAA